ncbi:MAG TPA: peptidylprolyl isomerase [Casimicrobiaceae bacterium]|nr:peptidylprolyl isomerase [Casimicrobiaceae bacterium]
MARHPVLIAATALLAGALGAGVAQAQFTTSPGIGPPSANAPKPAVRPAPSPAPRTNASVTLDRVVAVVNNEAVTQFDVTEQKRLVLAQMQDAKVQPPAGEALDKQVLERLITERAMLQFAKESGIRVDDQMVERAILRIAQDNKMSPEEFRRALEREKIAYAKYREDIRKEITIQRIREREVDSRVTVSDAELDAYLATVAAQAGGESEYLISHVLVTVPEQATPDQINARRKRAEDALAQIQGGKDFREVAATFSDAPDGVKGGDLGWRTPARLPVVFVEAVKGMKSGDVSPVLRSPGGFHVIKLVDSRNRNAPTVVEQTHVKHILIRVNEITSDTEAKAKIERIRDRIETGAKFDEQAKLNSEDTSSSKGGDLGWVNPGDTVPEFEKTMNSLAIGALSMPVRTQFGWHIIVVEGRRSQDVTLERKREVARNAIRQRKSDEEFAEFVRQTRDRAYVEYKTDDR